METLLGLTEQLKEGVSLDVAAVEAAAAALAQESVSGEAKKAFLVALSEKGETPEEIAAMAKAFLSRAISPGDAILEMAQEGIDYVGTGGDHSGAFNISTTTCFVLAAAGIKVIKHGNRGATSKSGTADLLERVGVPLDGDVELMTQALRELNFAFMFARSYHPAFKHIVPVRMELAKEGRRTVFNILGPLINPARPKYQVMGVYSEHWVEPLAETLNQMGLARGLVVHGKTFPEGVVDKFTTAGPSYVRGVGELKDLNVTYQPGDLNLQLADVEQIRGGDAEENFQTLLALLDGRGPAGLQETIYLNAGAGFWVMRRSDSLTHGIELAKDLVESGAVSSWLENARSFFMR